ncbi:MAG: sodium/glutamate symporter, partial [Cetobacterium sp.]
MNNFLSIIAYLSILILLGVVIKSKVKVLQDLFIPASIIGGIIGLILGPDLLGKYYSVIPQEWNSIVRGVPGVLIVPILISVPLGMEFGKKTKMMKNTVTTGGILFLVTFVQLFIGYFIN